jgi:CRP-like cAMP-binding protein
MDGFDKILEYVGRYIELTEQEAEYFVSLLRTRKVRKKQLISQPDFVCKHRGYVVSGAMRAYLVDDKGREHTIVISIEDWWISDFNSYVNQEPACLFVEALEDSVLVQIDYNSEQLLMERVPKFERFFRLITQRSFAFQQKRILSNLSKSAQERYDEFAQKYPTIVSRVPQYALASYLGFSTEFLSKIRNKKTKRS